MSAPERAPKPEPEQNDMTTGTNPGAPSELAEETTANLGRIAWLVTVGACLIAVVILLSQGYVGYAGVTFAVALAAAINLRR
jgi:hypothetical protein